MSDGDESEDSLAHQKPQASEDGAACPECGAERVETDTRAFDGYGPVERTVVYCAACETVLVGP